MKEIKLSDGKELLVVTPPIEAKEFRIGEDGDRLVFKCYNMTRYPKQIGWEYDGLNIPLGNWEIIGRVSEIMQSEEKCKEVVEYEYRSYESKRIRSYRNYYNNDCYGYTAIYSFKSFITAHSLNENDLLIVKI